jgi:hypothetical protein
VVRTLALFRGDNVNKPCADLGRIFKRYLEYRQVHETGKWNMEKHIGWRPAFDIIDRRWGIAGFFLLLPLHGVFRHHQKARIALENAMDRRIAG